MKTLPKENLLLLVTDTISINTAFLLGLLLRFDGQVPSSHLTFSASLVVPLTLFYLSFFYLFRLYKHLWHYASINELLSIFLAVSSSSFFFFLISMVFPMAFFPRSVILIGWIFLLFFVGGSRLLLRIYRQNYNGLKYKREMDRKRVLIIGAGDAGVLVLKELKKHRELKYQTIGFIDDDTEKKGLEIHGVRILGTSQEMSSIIQDHSIDTVIITIPSASGQEVKRLMEIAKRAGVHVKILPGMYEIISDRVQVSQLRDVQVEDLLRRDPVKLIKEDICSYIYEKRVLITGGGGSIGSELCKQVTMFNPSSLIIFDINENNIFETLETLETIFPPERIHAVVGSIQDQKRLRTVFSTYKPQVIFHAAAHKHVPLMEHNAEEAIKNNILGTQNVALLAHEFQVERFVLISTDKAVNPTNVMGASKRVAEMVVEMIDQTSKTCFLAVRFGNVLGSNGSVIPTFKRQIAKGGPVKVTHRDITRYFMTIPEAAQLVIQAGALGDGGEVFLLDMGDPVRIVDLAKDLIRLSGLEPEEDIEIEYIGLRPGEKLFEELLTLEEKTKETKHEKIFIARLQSINPILLKTKIKELERAVLQSSPTLTIPTILRSIVASYTPDTERMRERGS